VRNKELISGEKNLSRELTHFPLMEEYYTIQGEGFNAGYSAYFLRLAGCDVGCIWCDVKESWDANLHMVDSIDQMLHRVKSTPAAHVVITGGEPMMYDLSMLCELFKKNNLKLWLETSGAYKITGEWDWICVSPKKFKSPFPEALQIANELKVIIYNKSDFEWAEEHAEKVPSNCQLFLQPEYSKFDEMIPLIINYVKRKPRWRISLQTHKIIDVP
jgi:7-carboxy-7-deazaguanine synthase